MREEAFRFSQTVAAPTLYQIKDLTFEILDPLLNLWATFKRLYPSLLGSEAIFDVLIELLSLMIDLNSAACLHLSVLCFATKYKTALDAQKRRFRHSPILFMVLRKKSIVLMKESLEVYLFNSQIVF